MSLAAAVLRGRALSFGALVATAAAPIVACNGQLRFDDPDGAVAVVTPDAGVLDAGDPIDATVAVEASVPTPDAGGGGQARCVADPDCKLTTLHCDVVSGTCVACVVDAQCTTAGALRCDAALHRCVECGVDVDCGTDAKCEPITRRCVSTCKSLTGCHDFAPFCDISAGVCLRCHGDLECVIPGDARTCDPANGKCVQCVIDGQCRAPALRCDRTTGTCAACLSASDCTTAGAPLCDPSTKTCTAG